LINKKEEVNKEKERNTKENKCKEVKRERKDEKRKVRFAQWKKKKGILGINNNSLYLI
jgi:hypothetical protein